ncbi:MAG: WecB/TagA/CpsF family glycosyltransferase [Hyphomicrobiaceae bacterium]
MENPTENNAHSRADRAATGRVVGTEPEDGTISLFGLDVVDTTIERTAEWIVTAARAAKPLQVSFLNADCVNIMHRNPAYRDVLERSDRILADGIGVRLAARFAGHRLRDNVNGTDLFPILCRHAAAEQIGIFLFGARDGRARSAGEAMRDRNRGLIISGSHHGYIKDAADEARLIDAINTSGAGILLVALGAPAQELWIARNRHRLRPAVILGVGGLFDYYSGSVARAPLVIRRVGMEWAWRLAMEPKRLARRYLLGNAEFLMRLGMTSATSSRAG